MRKIDSEHKSVLPLFPNVEIAVRNFGPIAEGKVDLRPLTVFVGPSNTGKTYFATLIYALHGVSSGFSRFLLPRVLGSLIEKFGSRSQSTLSAAFAASSLEENRRVVNKLMERGRPFTFMDLPQVTRELVQENFKQSELFEQELASELIRCFDIKSVSELIQSTEENEMTVGLTVSEETQELWDFKMRTTDSASSTEGAFNEDMVIVAADGWWEEDGLSVDELSVLFPEFFHGLKGAARQRYYLPAARSGIIQSHRVIASSLVDLTTRLGVGPLEVPTFSGVVADFIKNLILYDEVDQPDERITSLADALESEVLAGQIFMKPGRGGYPEFFYRSEKLKEGIRLTRVSSMVSELAPLVLLLRGGIRSRNTLIIEEPEAHLHPGAQSEMALTLARLIRTGVRVVITTHSDWLLKEIANLIRLGELKQKGERRVKHEDIQASWLLPEEVGVWWFQKDGVVKPIPFERGYGVEPADYEDVADELYNRSVHLQDRLEEADRR